MLTSIGDDVVMRQGPGFFNAKFKFDSVITPYHCFVARNVNGQEKFYKIHINGVYHPSNAPTHTPVQPVVENRQDNSVTATTEQNNVVVPVQPVVDLSQDSLVTNPTEPTNVFQGPRAPPYPTTNYDSDYESDTVNNNQSVISDRVLRPRARAGLVVDYTENDPDGDLD